MFHYRKEGEPIKLGFNVYPKDDESSVGFVFSWKFRYQRFAWFCRKRKSLLDCTPWYKFIVFKLEKCPIF